MRNRRHFASRGSSRVYPVAAAATVVALLLGSVAVRSYSVTKGYEVARLEKRRSELLEERRALQNRLGDLLAYGRVEGVATGQLGLTVPRAHRSAPLTVREPGVVDRVRAGLRASSAGITRWLTRWF